IAQETVSWMKSNKKKKRIAVTTDSIADLPEDILQKFDIVTIPHKVRTDSGTFKDGIEINTSGVLAYLKNTDKTMLPLSPDVSEHENFFADQLTIANNVIHIAVSKDIENSGYESALEAANSFENVTVVNSEHLSSGQGLMAAYASRLASAGMSIPDIIDRLEIMKKCTHTSFIVDTLDYLARANQVSARRANLVRAFMVRPVVVMKNGVMKIGRVYIGERENSWKKYIDHCLATPHLNTTMIIVTYVGLTKKELEWIRKRIEKKVKFETIYFQEASPAIAVNCGPGTFGLLLFSDPE
ncbi:MAG: DegV family EDD domain-containing protein, partial [Eubacterium sp.]|nr:DegV family EDD domain-containing protein [Eubacterium sp.]